MGMTVGELVGYINLDDRGFDKGVDAAERKLQHLTSSTTAATGRMETDVDASFRHLLGQVESTLDDVVRESGQSGQRSGSAFSSSLDAALDAVDAVAGDAGRRAGEEFVDEARKELNGAAFAASIDAGFRPAEKAAAKSGQLAGDAFIRGTDGRLRDARGRYAKEGADLFKGLVVGAKSTGSAAGTAASVTLAASLKTAAIPAVAGALTAVAAAVAPAMGATMGAMIAVRLGAALVQLGVQSLFVVQEIDKSWSKMEKKRIEAANKQAKELQEQFKKLGRDATIAMQDAAQPMVSVLDEVRAQVKSLTKELGSEFADGFEAARVPMEQFVREMGAGLKDLGSAIQPLMRSFTDVLGEIDIEGWLGDVGDALEDLADTVSDNKAAIGGLFEALLDVLPAVFNGMASVIDLFANMSSASLHAAAGISKNVAGLIGVINSFGFRILEVVRTIGQALSNVPGMEEFGKRVVQGADLAIASMKEFKREADEASKAVQLKADIVDLTQKIGTARTLLADPNLKPELRAKLTAEITQLLRAKGEALVALGDPKLVAEYQSEITTEIATLQTRLATARKELEDPKLTKERKSRLNAEIKELQAQLALAKKALDSIPDVKVIKVRTELEEFGALKKSKGRAAGGIETYESGGIRPGPHVASSASILYGEGNGPEAFIPYESRYRARAIDLLSQVASDFGMTLVSPREGPGPSKGSDGAGSEQLRNLLLDMGKRGIGGLLDGLSSGEDRLVDAARRMTRRMAEEQMRSTADAFMGGGVLNDFKRNPAFRKLAEMMKGRNQLEHVFFGPDAGDLAVGRSNATYQNGQQGWGAPPPVNVDLRGSTIREEADIDRLGSRMGLEYSLRGASA